MTILIDSLWISYIDEHAYNREIWVRIFEFIIRIYGKARLHLMEILLCTWKDQRLCFDFFFFFFE